MHMARPRNQSLNMVPRQNQTRSGFDFGEDVPRDESTLSETGSQTPSMTSKSRLFLPLHGDHGFRDKSGTVSLNGAEDLKSLTAVDRYDLGEIRTIQHDLTDHPSMTDFPELNESDLDPYQIPDSPLIRQSLVPVTEKLRGGQLDSFRIAVEKVMKKQDEVISKRSQAHELRVALRRQRDKEQNLRADVVKKLNAIIAETAQDLTRRNTRSPTHPATDQRTRNPEYSILDIAEQLQTSSDPYLALENDYHQFEDQLERDEYALGKMEQKLLSSLSGMSSLCQSKPHDSAEMPSLDADDASFSTSDSEDNDYPPLLFDYLSRQGDARILRERLADLESDYIEVSDKKDSLSRVDIELDGESQVLLSTYVRQKSELQMELHSTERDIEQLKLKCEANGLLSPRPFQDNRPTRQQHTSERELSSPHLLNTSQGSTSMPFQQKLTEALRKNFDPLWHSEFEDISPFYERDSSQKLSLSKFINKWILHRLRHSSFEIFRLKSMPSLQKLGRDGISISNWVLKLWYEDDTVVVSRPQTPSATATLTKDSPLSTRPKQYPEPKRCNLLGQC